MLDHDYGVLEAQIANFYAQEKFTPKNYSSNASSIVYIYEKRKRWSVFDRRKYSKHNNDTHYDATSPLPQKLPSPASAIDLPPFAIHHPDAVLTYVGELSTTKEAQPQEYPLQFLQPPQAIQTCPHCKITYRPSSSQLFKCPVCNRQREIAAIVTALQGQEEKHEKKGV